MRVRKDSVLREPKEFKNSKIPEAPDVQLLLSGP